LGWKIEFRLNVRKAFKKLDKSIQKKILKFLNKKISPLKNPRVFGKSLSHDKYGLWRYRIENYRIICQINDDAIVIVVVKIGHGKEVYDE
jgi:mRNA interferase RelE/StbE